MIATPIKRRFEEGLGDVLGTRLEVKYIFEIYLAHGLPVLSEVRVPPKFPAVCAARFLFVLTVSCLLQIQ